MSPIQWTLVIAGMLGPAFVASVMLRRGLRSKFPFFFSYIALYILIMALDSQLTCIAVLSITT